MTTTIQKFIKVYKLCQKRAKQDHLSTFRQIAEISWFQLTRGFGYSTYHYAEMWHKSKSWDYKTGFLSRKNYIKRIYALNERKFQGITQYKLYEKAVFNLFKIPSADYVGTLNEAWGINSLGGNLRNPHDLDDLLKNHLGERLCFKLLEGSGGEGFKAFDITKKDGNLYACHISSKMEYDVEDLFQLLMGEDRRGWLIEKYISQHPVLKSLNATSVNTIRMYVLEDQTGDVTVLGGFLRIGRGGSLVDNSSAGGMVSKIDMQTGALQKICFFTPEHPSHATHPDHGAQVLGVIVPFWSEAKQIGIKTLKLLTNTRFAGFDITITEQGPLIVEINIQPDIEGLCFMQIRADNVLH
ncbi:MAG: hypothetical protein K9G26_09930 [Emcibacter sp.]|nr:hypothetical protein [Emcibacter sp.]